MLLQGVGDPEHVVLELFFALLVLLILEAHVGGIVEGGWVLCAWFPSCRCLDLDYTSLGSTGALDVGDVPVIKDLVSRALCGI